MRGFAGCLRAAQRRMPAGEQWGGKLYQQITLCCGLAHCRARSNQHAGRKCLAFALMVDGRVGHHRYSFFQIVGYVHTCFAQHRQRAVIAQRADRRLAFCQQVIQVGDVIALPARRLEQFVLQFRVGRLPGQRAWLGGSGVQSR